MLALVAGVVPFAARAQTGAASWPPTPPAPVLPPEVPLPPRPKPVPPTPAQLVALNKHREIDQLRREQGEAAAFALYRKYYFTPYDEPLDPVIVSLRGIYTRHFAAWLTREGRAAEAEALIAEYITLSRGLEDKAGGTSTKLVELQIYLAAGRGDVPAVLRLLDQHQRFDRKLQRDGACFNGDFPGHVAPTQHDPRVAAKLRAMGCRQEIIDQLDDLASRGLERNMFEPGLPPRALPKAQP